VSSRYSNKKKGYRKLRKLLKGLGFISPWIVGFSLFTLYPIIASLYYSLTYYDILRPPVYIGLRNYAELAVDPSFHQTLSNTLWWVVFAVPGSVLVGLILALLLNQQLPLRSWFRTIFFVPSIVPAVSAAMLWTWIYNSQYGLINGYLSAWGFRTIPWLSSPHWSKPSLLFIHLWSSGGTMIIFLAALQDVPKHLYEAARIDGASKWHEFWYITIPMISPAILFNILTGAIGAFQYFTFPMILTGGGPVGSTEFYSLYLYRNAFRWFKMGYASALAWILFLFVLVYTILVFRSSAKWVYYEGGN
jgi:multiple sugar transport system permease protein